MIFESQLLELINDLSSLGVVRNSYSKQFPYKCKPIELMMFYSVSTATNVQGDGAASIVFKVEDSDGQQSSSKTLTFNIANVDDLPTGADDINSDRRYPALCFS